MVTSLLIVSVSRRTDERASAGFTFIELLVVLALIGLSVSLVSPRIVGFYEKILVRQEERGVAELVDGLRMKAFLRQEPIRLLFEGNRVVLASGRTLLRCRLLQFEESSVRINGNGFCEESTVRYRVHDAEKSLQLPQD